MEWIIKKIIFLHASMDLTFYRETMIRFLLDDSIVAFDRFVFK